MVLRKDASSNMHLSLVRSAFYSSRQRVKDILVHKFLFVKEKNIIFPLPFELFLAIIQFVGKTTRQIGE
jgi:hypothetical protein